jgi:hypothetical protein
MIRHRVSALMPIEMRLTELSDKELEDLHGNAIRLSQSGSPSQQAAAENLLPNVGAEIARRAAARKAAQIPTRPPARVRPKRARKTRKAQVRN